MIDFHCHIDLYPDPTAIVGQASRIGAYVLAVTTTPAAWTVAEGLVRDCRRVRLAVGIHPELAHTPHADVDRLTSLLPHTRYVGEVGLDGTPSFREHVAAQRNVFDRVLAACSHAGGKILSIHSRRAVTEVLDSLERRPDAGTAVLHWFSGTQAQLRRAIDLGCWFSIGPAMASSASGREVIRMMPRSRVLTESDGPFVEVQARPSTPNDMPYVESLIASTWDNISPAEVRAQLLANLRRLVMQK